MYQPWKSTGRISIPTDKVEEWKSISGTYITSKALLTAVEAKLSPIEITIPQNKQDTETHIFLNPKHSNITSTLWLEAKLNI